MLTTLLQIDSTGTATKTTESLWGLLAKGGPLMIPLGILFALAVFFFIERLLAIRKASKIEDSFMNQIRDNIVSGNLTSAKSLAKN
jgi:biopolymer transport protein ExbB